MNKNVIFAQRRELKAQGHKVVKSHYIILVFLTLVLTLSGLEFRVSTVGLEKRKDITDYVENGTGKADPGNMFTADDIVVTENPLAVLRRLYRKLNAEKAPSPETEEQEEITEAEAATEGVLAAIVNNVGSGTLFVKFGQSLRSIIRSDTAAVVVLIIGSFLWYGVIYVFLGAVYMAAARRIFLEARIYEKVSFLEVMHFAMIRKWLKAAWIMLVYHVRLGLWSLTIIGAFIKTYSYWAVPYIVAENPDMTADQAITLSRKMMDGHKWELFKYQLTFAGWVLLGVVTLGFSDFLYGSSYRLACQTEFYVRIRELAKERQLEGAGLLNDEYLFRKADRILLYETYFDVIDEITVYHENKDTVTLTGWRKFAADWFGLWLASDSMKKAYDEQEGRAYTIARYRLCLEGKAYPSWLYPSWPQKEIRRQGHFSYLRHYTVWVLFLLFILFSFVGWSWEVALHLIQTGELANRGTLHGPWLPIYGTGGVIALMLCSRFRKNPVAEFFVATGLCGLIEYFTALYLETVYHQRWWSYDGYFLNLHGRICAEGLLVFGVACCLVVYLLAPVFDYLLSKVKLKVLIGISAVLAVIFGIDAVYSGMHPNAAKGAVEEAAVQTENDMEKV